MALCQQRNLAIKLLNTDTELYYTCTSTRDRVKHLQIFSVSTFAVIVTLALRLRVFPSRRATLSVVITKFSLTVPLSYILHTQYHMYVGIHSCCVHKFIFVLFVKIIMFDQTVLPGKTRHFFDHSDYLEHWCNSTKKKVNFFFTYLW